MKNRWFLLASFVLFLIPACKQASQPVPAEDTKAQAEASDASKEADAAPDAEQKENELVKRVPVAEAAVIPSEIDELMKKKKPSDEELEKIGLFFMEQPMTRDNVQQARNALRQVKQHTDAKAEYWRGMDELNDPRRRFDDKLQKAAIKHIRHAAELGNPNALQATLEYPGMALEGALDKLDAYYAQESGGAQEGQKDAKPNPQQLYQWAKAIESGPYETAGKKSESLLKQAADLDYLPARYAYANLLMADMSNEPNWKRGLDYMRDAAMAGNPDANRSLASLMSQYKNAPEDVFSADQRFLLNTLVTQSGKSIDEIIFNYATRAGGQESALQTLFGMTMDGGSEELSQALVTSAVAFMETSASRDGCDHLAQDFDWKGLHDGKKLSDNQIKTLSNAVLKCYQDALLRGDDYPSDASIGGPSTAVVMASLFNGSEQPFARSKDEDTALSYLVFGAQLDQWDAQWALAQYYENTANDKDRACFWAKKAYKSDFCASVCKDNAEYVEACSTCKPMREMIKKCK